MWTSGYADTMEDLYGVIDNALINVGWIKHTFHQYCNMYEGIGGGTDKIYIMLDMHRYVDRTDEQGNAVQGTHDRLSLDAAVGYDPDLGAFEQPGSLQQWFKSKGNEATTPNLPEFCITPNERFFYWLFCDTYRLIVVCRMSIVYESMYIGFLNPIASERQYPYPMYVCGNTTKNGAGWPNNANGSFVFPNGAYIRRADGVWRACSVSKPNPSPSGNITVFPYNSHNQRLIPNYKEDDAINQDNFLLIPVMLQANNPVDICGLMRGCHWVSGTRDIDAERILVYNGEQYMVFDTKQDRGANTYFAVHLA